jgi:hypothetical protein
LFANWFANWFANLAISAPDLRNDVHAERDPHR